jgi:hypothetical protein
MDGIRDYHVKQNMPDSEGQIQHVFSHMQNPDFKKRPRNYKGDYLGRGRGLAGGGEGTRKGNRACEYNQGILYTFIIML